MILLHLKTFWEESISFTKLPGIQAEKSQDYLYWHVSDRDCYSGWVLDRRAQGAESDWVWGTLGGTQRSLVALRRTLVPWDVTSTLPLHLPCGFLDVDSRLSCHEQFWRCNLDTNSWMSFLAGIPFCSLTLGKNQGRGFLGIVAVCGGTS